MSDQSNISRADSGLPGDREHARRWWILAVLGTSQLMIILDTSVVNIALPSAQAALHFTNANRQWIITAYALAFGSLLLLGGRFGGRRSSPKL
jgi:MFS family permease